MLHILTTLTYLDDGVYISGRLLHIWTMEVTYLDDCYIFGRLHICTSHVCGHLRLKRNQLIICHLLYRKPFYYGLFQCDWILDRQMGLRFRIIYILKYHREGSFMMMQNSVLIYNLDPGFFFMKSECRYISMPSQCHLSFICMLQNSESNFQRNAFHNKTRSTPRAQTSAVPRSRSAKPSSQAWNTLTNSFLCPYPENVMNIHPSVIP